ncbi:MAG: lipocalin-like domain-containing protein [Planctomycetes bacterium]|nr:lipocalin-like domain-containing protein [Planctomycetota bacterium]
MTHTLADATTPVSPFVGTWRLVKFEMRLENGKTIYPLGEDCLGSLIYDEHGRFAGHLMKAGRPEFASGNIFEGTANEIKAAYSGYVAYFGTYEVDDQRKVITHTAEGSLFPNWIGTMQERLYEFPSQDEVIESTPPLDVGGVKGVSALTWARITS